MVLSVTKSLSVPSLTVPSHSVLRKDDRADREAAEVLSAQLLVSEITAKAKQFAESPLGLSTLWGAVETLTLAAGLALQPIVASSMSLAMKMRIQSCLDLTCGREDQATHRFLLLAEPFCTEFSTLTNVIKSC